MKPAGYSGTPLAKKLGIKPDQRVHLVNAPKEFAEWVGPDLDQVELVDQPKKPLAFVAIFVTSKADFTKRLPKLIDALAPNGMIWVCWPKKTSKMPTDLDENIIRDIALD